MNTGKNQKVTKEYYAFMKFSGLQPGGGKNSHIVRVGVCHWVCEGPTLY